MTSPRFSAFVHGQFRIAHQPVLATPHWPGLGLSATACPKWSLLKWGLIRRDEVLDKRWGSQVLAPADDLNAIAISSLKPDYPSRLHPHRKPVDETFDHPLRHFGLGLRIGLGARRQARRLFGGAFQRHEPAHQRCRPKGQIGRRLAAQIHWQLQQRANCRDQIKQPRLVGHSPHA